ncbi:hypothetical protein GCM10023405_33060 [Streptomonospora salina]
MRTPASAGGYDDGITAGITPGATGTAVDDRGKPETCPNRGSDMSEGSAFDKIKSKVGEHSGKVEEGVDKLKDFAKEKTGGKYDDKIDQAGDAATDFVAGEDGGEEGGSGTSDQR